MRKTIPKVSGKIFTTYVRSKYVYALQYVFLSKILLEMDRKHLDGVSSAPLRLRNPLSPSQRKLVNALFRIDDLQQTSCSTARKALNASDHESEVVKEFNVRD